MRKRPLPPSFVQVPTELLVQLAKQAKATRLPLNVVLEDVLQRGLSCAQEERMTAPDLEAEWFAHLVEHAPTSLDETQRRLLAASYRIRGVWCHRTGTVGEFEEGLTDAAPRLNAEALKRAWSTVRRMAATAPEERGDRSSGRLDAA